MSPDLNSLPPRRPSMTSASPLSERPRRISINTSDPHGSPPSPRSPSLSSLAAAATINAGLHRSPSRTSPSLERRRSYLLNTISHNDPSIPAPGEMQQSNGGSPRLGRRSFSLNTADPHHTRQPSLGELHQELENEQESQVNRLLQMIRAQQHELATVRRQHNDASPTLSDANGLPTPPTPASADTFSPTTHAATGGYPPHRPRQQSFSRDSSARISFTGTSSRGASPALRPQSGSLGPLTEDLLLGGTRDECSFYQAETSNLTRENQMLKHRIAELERQIAEMGGPGTAHSPLAGPPSSVDGVPTLASAKVE